MKARSANCRRCRSVGPAADACGSENHVDEFCWIKNGLKAHNLRLPPAVAEQYELWHKQHVKGEYKKVPGGPPRVRLARTARPQKAPASSLATVSEDEDEYNANYCGSAAGDAHELDKWAQAVRWQSSSYAPAFTFGAGMVESFGKPSVSSPALPTADRLTVSRGRRAKRGEKESKRHHGSTQQQNATPTYPLIPHREFPTVVTD